MYSVLAKYALLLVDYCLEIQADQHLYITSTTLAEPLVREVYRVAIQRGAHVVTDLTWREKNRIFYQEAGRQQLIWQNPFITKIYEEFDAILFIRAPYNLREEQDIDPAKRAARTEALAPIHQIYNARTADRSLKRCLCQFPTQAAAQQAGMSLEAYETFVFRACHLFTEEPADQWRKIGAEQQRLVDFLNSVEHMRYLNSKTDLQFGLQGRTWINSDGKTNMPSGEVFTAPVEDSVNGTIFFDFPSIFRGHLVQNITLDVEDGQIVRWKAEQGQNVLDELFEMEGSRRFGEAAIGTNYEIQEATGNILFDEKMGGTVHLAVGQSYFQTGGQNKSPIHWDMIADMKNGGRILADGKEIYENGKFLI